MNVKLTQIIDCIFNENRYKNTKIYGLGAPASIKLSVEKKPYLSLKKNFRNKNHEWMTKYEVLHNSNLTCKNIQEDIMIKGRLYKISLREKEDFLRADLGFHLNLDGRIEVIDNVTVLTCEEKTKKALISAAKTELQHIIPKVDSITKALVDKYSPETIKPKYVIKKANFEYAFK